MSKKVKRPSKLESIAMIADQDHADLDTMSIVRRRAVLSCHVEAHEAELAELGRRMISVRRERSIAEAQIAGLNAVIARR